MRHMGTAIGVADKWRRFGLVRVLEGTCVCAVCWVTNGPRRYDKCVWDVIVSIKEVVWPMRNV